MLARLTRYKSLSGFAIYYLRNSICLQLDIFAVANVRIKPHSLWEANIQKHATGPWRVELFVIFVRNYSAVGVGVLSWFGCS